MAGPKPHTPLLQLWLKSFVPGSTLLKWSSALPGVSLGRRSAEDQREFVKVFTGLLGRSYTDRIESYTSQTILYTREIEDKDYAEVDTKIVTDKREELSINYKLHSVNNEWRVPPYFFSQSSTIAQQSVAGQRKLKQMPGIGFHS